MRSYEKTLRPKVPALVADILGLDRIAIVGATGLFANPATPPSGFVPAVGSASVRALATPQAPCLGLSCPNGLHCSVLDNGIPTCVP